MMNLRDDVVIIKSLIEDTSVSNDFVKEHGLSLYIETKGIKILFDVGKSGLFAENARKLNVDISDIDYLIISHGHYDHGGGLGMFLSINSKAKVFIHKNAFDNFYSFRENGKIDYIGLNKELKQHKQIMYTSDNHFITTDIQLFMQNDRVKEVSLPPGNNSLFILDKYQVTKDSFNHEQNMIIKEEDKFILFTGCAHKGIINIIEKFKILKDTSPDYVIGGFHLSAGLLSEYNNKYIQRVSNYLGDTNTKYYTCHCTGIENYYTLMSSLGDNISYLSGGSVITI